MSRSIPESFQPYIGLSSIALDDRPAGSGLPDDSRLQPIDASVEARLKIMLQAETFDSMILEAVRPKAFDRNVLAPSRFHVLREAVTARLAALRANATGPAAAELDAAAAVLERRGSEHELGEALRYALLKG